MYDKFTDRARRVMLLAQQEAQRFNHEYIGTEHVLLGLVKEGSGVAANVLKNFGIDLRKMRLEIDKLVQTDGGQIVLGRLPQTPQAKRAIEYSIEEAQNLNHKYVGTEHLLLGLLRQEDADTHVAAAVLKNLGLKSEDVRQEILNLLEVKKTRPNTGAVRLCYPLVIWTGSEPLKERGRFRLVHRGPARVERPDDVPFSLEKQLGIDMMKKPRWGDPTSGDAKLAIWAMSHALGLLLTVDPKQLNLDHPLYCELNLAVAEKREPRGCDCHAPADPIGKEKRES